LNVRVDWRTRLRELPVFDTVLPPFDPDAAPADPMELAAAWLDDAIAAGIPEPHAGVWGTVDVSGAPSSRTLIIKDLTAEGFWCATPSTTALGEDVRDDPRAALHLYWPRLGRQLRVLGDLVRGPSEVSAADWTARSAAARAGADETTWTAYLLRPVAIEFFAAQEDRSHRRARYASTDGGWTRMVPSTRFERATSSSGGKRSIH
jgi:pyridoxamine 5'-phosphate oxidase